MENPHYTNPPSCDNQMQIVTKIRDKIHTDPPDKHKLYSAAKVKLHKQAK